MTPPVQTRQRVLRDRAASVGQRRVVTGDRADDDGGRGGPQSLRDDARVLQRLPGQFGEEPLLGVDRHGLARRDPEERRVELVHAVEEPAVAQRGAVPLRRVRQHLVRVPTVLWYLADRTPARPQQLPEGAGVGCLGRRHDMPVIAIASVP